MKNYLFTFILIISVTCSFAGNLKIIDPLNPWNSIKANIDTAQITVTPFLYYAQVDLELVYSAKETYYASYSNLALEVVTDFIVPDKTIIIDSWLWIEDYISEAYLIDLYTATNVYESYVTRNQDPSLLRFNRYSANKLDLNIYPLPANSSRKVKLSFLVPIKNESSAFSVSPIIDIFSKENTDVFSYCKVIVNHNANYTQSALRFNPTEILNSQSTTTNNTFVINMNAIDEDFNIVYQNATINNKYSYKSTINNEGYYYFEKYIPLDLDNCTVGSLNKVMDNSSFTHDVFNESTVLTNGVLLKESGMYFQNPPQNFILEYACNNVVTKDTLNIIGFEDFTAEKIWAKKQINKLTTANYSNSGYYYTPYNNEPYYADIITTSMNHRVLSRYTAFLALPREDTVVASLDGGYIDNNVTVGIVANGTGYNNTAFNINCYPNPMVENLKLNISNFNDNYVKDIQSKIVNIEGKIVHEFKPFNMDANTDVVLSWSGNDLFNIPVQSGVYFFVMKANGKTYTFEIVRI